MKSKILSPNTKMNSQSAFTSIILIVTGLLLMGCNPSKFQVDTNNTESGLSTTSSTLNNSGSASSPNTASNKLSCVLVSNKQSVSLGEDVKFSFNTNFNIPKNAQMIWTGKSFGIELTTPPENSKFYLNLGLSYKLETQAGIHKRQVKLIDANGNLICSSNLLKVEFVGSISADQICRQVGGQLGGEDNEVCSVEEWNFYREMTSRNVFYSSGAQIGGNIGMANPASVYCSSIGGNHELSSGMCSMNKYKLLNLYNGVTAGPSVSGKPLLGKDVTALNFSYSSGAVSPAYQYSVGYKLDFLRKSVQVSVTKGASVVAALPTSGVRSLTDTQIANIKSLLGSLAASNCDEQMPTLGGGVSSLSVYTSSSYNLDSYVWINSCQPFSEVQNQYKSSTAESQQLMDFLKSL